MQNFDLNLLASLDALLAEKNVTRAAKKMHVTQSTMSGILRRLRDQFDDELLIRNGRHYDLSPFAQSLAISVRQTILQIDSTISAKPLFDPKKDRRKFRIMASDYSTMVYLSALFRRLEKQAPYLSYDIVPIDSPLEHVRGGTVDLCVTGNPYSQAEAAADQLLRADTLFSEVYCCVVDNDHPLRGIVTLDQLFEFPHVMAQFTGVTMQTSELRVGSARNRANPVISVPSFNVIPALVSGTRSVGILPTRMMEVAPGWSGLRTLAVAFEMPSFTEHLIWHSRFAYDPAFCWLRSVMLGTA
ncbi:MAG TPA: LysR family transcriptional regulator [Xanthobacteraceae bacterium]|nr:LysR family transcriptional regulator [Xanthobacteraceae bacterium]